MKKQTKKIEYKWKHSVFLTVWILYFPRFVKQPVKADVFSDNQKYVCVGRLS